MFLYLVVFPIPLRHRILCFSKFSIVGEKLSFCWRHRMLSAWSAPLAPHGLCHSESTSNVKWTVLEAWMSAIRWTIVKWQLIKLTHREFHCFKRLTINKVHTMHIRVYCGLNVKEYVWQMGKKYLWYFLWHIALRLQIDRQPFLFSF